MEISTGQTSSPKVGAINYVGGSELVRKRVVIGGVGEVTWSRFYKALLPF